MLIKLFEIAMISVHFFLFQSFEVLWDIQVRMTASQLPGPPLSNFPDSPHPYFKKEVSPRDGPYWLHVEPASVIVLLRQVSLEISYSSQRSCF